MKLEVHKGKKVTGLNFWGKFSFLGIGPKYSHFGPEIDIFQIFSKTDHSIFLKICKVLEGHNGNHLIVILIHRNILFRGTGPKYGHFGSEIDIFQIFSKTNC